MGAVNSTSGAYADRPTGRMGEEPLSSVSDLAESFLRLAASYRSPPLRSSGHRSSTIGDALSDFRC